MNIGQRTIMFAGALFAFFLIAHGPASAEYVCPPGTGECPDGKCAPFGSVCCADGGHCNAGSICISGNKCLSKNSSRVCSNGRYCDAGYVCTKEGKCLSTDSPSFCGGRKYCDSGFACIEGDKCLSMDSPRYCGDGKYCEAGFVCAGGGKCRSESMSIPDGLGSNDSDEGKKGAPISDSCLNIGPTKTVSGFIGECTMKDGSTAHNTFTMVTSTMAQGCPKEIEFDYLDTDTGELLSWHTPFNVQVCGGEPFGIGVKK